MTTLQSSNLSSVICLALTLINHHFPQLVPYLHTYCFLFLWFGFWCLAAFIRFASKNESRELFIGFNYYETLGLKRRKEVRQPQSQQPQCELKVHHVTGFHSPGQSGKRKGDANSGAGWHLTGLVSDPVLFGPHRITTLLQNSLWQDVSELLVLF